MLTMILRYEGTTQREREREREFRMLPIKKVLISKHINLYIYFLFVIDRHLAAISSDGKLRCGRRHRHHIFRETRSKSTRIYLAITTYIYILISFPFVLASFSAGRFSMRLWFYFHLWSFKYRVSTFL